MSLPTPPARRVVSNCVGRGRRLAEGVRRPLAFCRGLAHAPLAAALLLCCLAGPGSAADPYKATTSGAARREAQRALDLQRLDPADRQRVARVLKNTSLYRRMPTRVIDCDPQMYEFLVEHPEVIVNLWDVMGISNVSLVRTGPDTLRAADGEGTVGSLTIVDRSHDRRVLFAEGSYSGPLFQRPVHGECVLLLRSRALRETDGRVYITCRLDSFLHVDRVGLELLARTFQPLVGYTADANFTETLAFVGNFSRTAERNPRGIERIAPRLTQVHPQVRGQLVQLAHAVATRSAGVDQDRGVYHASAEAPRVQRIQRGQGPQR